MRIYRAALCFAVGLFLSLSVPWLAFGAAAPEHTEAARPVGSFLVTGFEFTGNASIETWMLEDVVAHGVGQFLNMDGLNAIADEITNYYREQGYWLALAYLPEQEVSDGVVLIAVREGHYGNVRVESYADVPEELGPRILRDVGPGDVIYGPRLESAILLLSDVPGVEANASLSPGSEPGTADLHVVLRPIERFVVGWTANNHGSGSSNAFRSILNARWDNPRGYGDHFSGSLVSTNSGTHFGRLAYEAPINHRELRLNIAYNASRYKLGNEFAALEASGESRRFSFIANHPVFRGGRVNLNGEAGYAQTDIHETIASISDSKRTVSALSGALHAEWRGQSGGTVSATLEVRQGSVRLRSASDLVFDQAGPKTAGDFRKATADIMVVQPFGAHAAISATASGQWASKNLDPTEKLALGGPEGVRAYSPDEASVDEGWLGHLEVRRNVSLRWLPGLREGTLFLDVGQGQVNKAPWPGSGGPKRVTLAGGGVGLVWHFDPITAELSYALPISIGEDAPEAGGLLWWQASMRF